MSGPRVSVCLFVCLSAEKNGEAYNVDIARVTATRKPILTGTYIIARNSTMHRVVEIMVIVLVAKCVEAGSDGRMCIVEQ